MRMEMLSMKILMALKMVAILLRAMTVRFVEGPGENWEEQGVEEEERGGTAQCSWPRRWNPRRPRRCCRRGCPWSCREKPGQGQLCASFKLEWRQVVKIFFFCRHQWELNKKSQFPRNPLFVERNSKFNFIQKVCRVDCEAADSLHSLPQVESLQSLQSLQSLHSLHSLQHDSVVVPKISIFF